MACRQVYFNFSYTSGIATNQTYDMVDNNGYYVFQQLTGAALLSGLTLSISSTSTSFSISSSAQNATWSACNPYISGYNAPLLPQIWSPSNTNSSLSLTNSNLTINGSLTVAAPYRCAIGLNSFSSNNIYYFEVVKNTIAYNQIGVCTSAAIVDVLAGYYLVGSTDAYSAGYWDYQGTYHGGSPQLSPPTSQTAGTLMCAFNPSTGRIWFGFNGTWFNSGSPSTNTNPAITGFSGALYPIVGMYNATNANPALCTGNFTSASWNYPSAATGCIAMA